MTKIFGVDLRSLALFRMLIGMYLLVDVVQRLPWIIELYADDGFLPRDGRVGLASSPWLISLHMSSGNALMLSLAFLGAILLAVGMVIGYRTRFCAIGSWILFASMHARNPFVDGLAEDVLLGLLFWSMFVPLNARWSLDGALNPEHLRRPNWYSSLGVVALMLQVCFVYWFTSLVQSSELFPQGTWLSPGLVATLKVVGPGLVFLPFATDAVRFALVVVFVALHLSAAVIGASGAALVCAGAWTLFLPGPFWDAMDERVAGARSFQRFLDRVVKRLRAMVGERWGWAQRRLAPRRPAREPGMFGRAIIVAAMVLVLSGYALNASMSTLRLPPAADAVATMAQLGQPWSSSPKADSRHGWFVIEGVEANGKRVDMLRETAVNWARPAELGKDYSDPRRELYMMWLLDPAMTAYRQYYGGHLCLKWNSRYGGPVRLTKVYMNYMQDPPGAGGPSKLFLLEYSCPK